MGTAFTCVLLGSLASATVFDLRERRIPNSLVLFMIVGWLMLMMGTGVIAGEGAKAGELLGKGLQGALLLGGGSLLLAVVYERMRGQASLGGGDVKLLFVLGLYLGFAKGSLCVLFACLSAVILAWVVPHTPFANAPGAKAGQIPFAPTLFAGVALTLVLV